MSEVPKAFRDELADLINKHSIENFCDTTDFLLSGVLYKFIEGAVPALKLNLNWHGADSICHPKPKDLT